MWKLLIVVAISMHLGDAQRSYYAARPGSTSKLLPRFRKNETDLNLDSRGGEESNFSTTTLSPELQGTLEDREFVHRVSQWPEARQPFWYKNRKTISSFRQRETDGGDIIPPASNNIQRLAPPFRSPFQGPTTSTGASLRDILKKIRAGTATEYEFYSIFSKSPFLLDEYESRNN